MARRNLTIWAGPNGTLDGLPLPWPAQIVWVAPETARGVAHRVDGVRDLLGEHGLDLDLFGSVLLAAHGRGVALVESLLGDPELSSVSVALADPPPGNWDRCARAVRDAARGFGRVAVVSSPPHSCRAWCDLPALRAVERGAALRGFTWRHAAIAADVPQAIRAEVARLAAPEARALVA